jgi:hypothetical protein
VLAPVGIGLPYLPLVGELASWIATAALRMQASC